MESEVVLVTVKTFDLVRTATELARALSPRPTLFLQNGLGILPTARNALAVGGWADPRRISFEGSTQSLRPGSGPGEVRETGLGEVLLPVPGEVVAGRGGRAPLPERVLEGARLPVEEVPEFDREVWRKVLMNAAINPVTAVRRVPNGRLVDEPTARGPSVLLHEALPVARAEGHEFPARRRAAASSGASCALPPRTARACSRTWSAAARRRSRPSPGRCCAGAASTASTGRRPGDRSRKSPHARPGGARATTLMCPRPRSRGDGEKRGVASAPVHGRRCSSESISTSPWTASGQIADDRRIVEALPTLNHLPAAGAGRSSCRTSAGRNGTPTRVSRCVRSPTT